MGCWTGASGHTDQCGMGSRGGPQHSWKRKSATLRQSRPCPAKNPDVAPACSPTEPPGRCFGNPGTSFTLTNVAPGQIRLDGGDVRDWTDGARSVTWKSHGKYS